MELNPCRELQESAAELKQRDCLVILALKLKVKKIFYIDIRDLQIASHTSVFLRFLLFAFMCKMFFFKNGLFLAKTWFTLEYTHRFRERGLGIIVYSLMKAFAQCVDRSKSKQECCRTYKEWSVKCYSAL